MLITYLVGIFVVQCGSTLSDEGVVCHVPAVNRLCLLCTLTSLKSHCTCIEIYWPCQFQSPLYAENIQARLAKVIRELMSVT